MLKRTLFFTTPCHLSVRLSQLLVHRPDQEERTVPLEDIGVLVLENPAITLGVALLQRLQDLNVAVVICDDKHMPGSMLLPFSANHVHGEVLRFQIEASLPLTKRLWQQTVQAKIRNQGELLRLLGRSTASRLLEMAREVRSNDADNREGVAARLYWQSMFEDQDFVRDREGPAPNSLLNYGYAILRAATARALVSSGLLCAIGIHHRNRYNSFGLADDIMEPYRPFVDQLVCAMMPPDSDETFLSPQTKMRLLEILSWDTRIHGDRSPLMVALSSTTASLVRCLKGDASELVYPTFP